MPRSSFTDWWDRIAALAIPAPEKAVLQCLARHGDWEDGTHSYPKVGRIANETGYSEGTVRRALRSLECDATFDGECERRYCHHLALVVCTDRARQYLPAIYALTLDEQAFQPHLPEVSGRSERPARPIRATTEDDQSAHAERSL
ncbi:hypothetical protein LCGC14_0443530 [marine sediment metagenome]|uniref:Helix-turn-helix domain-containing protein n=1 Tax=marine sediment metagenome TaxID=412755 RepID=A0A0F9T2W0_9ZZZZ